MGAQPGSLIGPYRILNQIGEGGMGQVFAAVHEGTGQEVALKLLLKEAADDRQVARRFDREYGVLAALRHRHIVKVFAWDRLDDGTAYFAMERLDGINLREWSSRHGRPVELKTALAIGRQIADAMREVHEHGVVHRDLKPANVIVLNSGTAESPAPVIKVVDFGIAKVPTTPTGGIDTQVLTISGAILGTLAYMPPEQCLNVENVDAAADVYALGVMLFELLAGRLPFVSDDGVELITKKHSSEGPPFLGDLVRDAPPEVCVLIDSMLAKEPRERPSMRRCSTKLAEFASITRKECPLPGLQSFEETNAELFFGRRVLVDELIEQLVQAQVGNRRWVHIEGSSGSGKSSLVQAGIRPRLQERSPDGTRWLVACMRPSGAPLWSLAQTLVGALSEHGLEQTSKEVLTELQADSSALRSFASRTPRGYTLLLIIEQMEELFTLGAHEVASFDAQLYTALVDNKCPLRLLTTMRSDFIHHLERMPKLACLLNKAAHRHYLLSMQPEALRQVVQGMAQRAGLRLGASLADRIVRDATSTDCPLPLLGHALRALWSPEDREPGSLDERYERIGGVVGALSSQATDFLEKLGDEGRERAKWMILDLVRVARGESVTRRSRSLENVLIAGGNDAMAKEILMRLSGVRLGPSVNDAAELRLLVISGNTGDEPSTQQVDLIHETLLREIPIIERWLDRERLRLEQYADLEGAADVWRQAGRPKEGLPSGALLEHYRGSMQDERRHELLGRMVSELAREFLNEAEAAELRRRLSKRIIQAALVVAVAAIVVSGLNALWQRKIAEETLHSFISAMDDIVSDIDWKLGRKPGNRELREKQLNRVYTKLTLLPAEERERPEVRLVLIKAEHRLGDFALSDGTLADAERWYKKASEEIKSAGERALEDEEWEIQPALNASKLGKVALARGRLDEAQQFFSQALRLMVARGEQSEDQVRTLATSYVEQADLELELGQYKAALDHYDDAIRRFDRIKDGQSEGDGGKYNRSLLAEARIACASAARRSGDLARADDLLTKAMKDIDPSFAEAITESYYHSIVARLHIEIGELRYREGKNPEAASEFEAVRKTSYDLVTGDPTRKAYALLLGQLLEGLERLAKDQPDKESAAQLREERRRRADQFVGQDPEDVRFMRLRQP